MKEAQSRSLSVEAWLALEREGISLPVTIRLQGRSMEPLIRGGRDAVTIVPLKGKPAPGDVILFRRGEGAYVLHRLYRADPRGTWLQTWGDNCLRPDGPISPDAALGLAVAVEKEGRLLRLDTRWRRTGGLLWLKCPLGRPLWRLSRRIRAWIGRHRRK